MITIEKDTNEVYHSKTEYIGSTSLKKIKQSPLHFRDCKFKKTDALDFGTAAHAFVLEPDLFHSEYHIFDEDNRPEPEKTFASKLNKAWKEGIYKDHANVISSEDYQKLIEMKKYLFSNFYAKYLLTKGVNELSHYIDVFEDVGCKFRPDSLHVKKRIVVDYKTVADASLEGCMKYIANYDGHIQAAYYTDLFEHCYPSTKPAQFYWVFQEKTKPYGVNILKASSQLLDCGRYEYDLLLQEYRHMKETGEFCGYEVFADNDFGIIEVNLPAWKIKEFQFKNLKSKKQ